jgi:hypothetical protein
LFETAAEPIGSKKKVASAGAVAVAGAVEAAEAVAFDVAVGAAELGEAVGIAVECTVAGRAAFFSRGGPIEPHLWCLD